MKNLRRSLFWAAVYISIIIVLGLFDLDNKPIINFASFFYLVAILVFPFIIIIPSLHKVSVYWPMIFVAGIYFGINKVVNRSLSGSSDIDVIVLEYVLIEIGVYLACQLAGVIAHSESLLDTLAQGTFPNRALDFDSASENITAEFNRGRRYHRQITLLVIEIVNENREAVHDLMKGLQQDVLARLLVARFAQIISENIRQTDLLARDYSGRFIVVCPETDLENTLALASRIGLGIQQRTGVNIKCGVATFPAEALTYEDLLHIARERLTQSISEKVDNPTNVKVGL